MHHFFRRHVYSASRGHMSRPMATVITFLISALAHELVMGCITRKFRGYGFIAMMLQMPIVMVQRSKWVRGRTLLNNVLFWCSMILGLSMVRLENIYLWKQVLTGSRCAPCMFLSDILREEMYMYKRSFDYRCARYPSRYLVTAIDPPRHCSYCMYPEYCFFIEIKDVYIKSLVLKILCKGIAY